MSLFTSEGPLRYSRNKDGSYRLVVEVDMSLALYTRRLIPPHYRVQGPRYEPHITVVRKEIPENLQAWGLDENRLIRFEVDPRVRNDGFYWWLRVFSPELLEVRHTLGLPAMTEWTRPPDGEDCFHSTVANTKP